ncbi:hypothetical protein K8354_04455 [Polaribacter litorisediminis]|uniref:DUF6090 family protein n=1 Tax=Polaribacter litorisediminis TaxID=1908341 RepID=UPI001CBAD202|nr:DUF6090 family protein [Polaribacter litorisediminis]UAM99082.1 hypothetical protein K8354_04455 [Polaribacter litorisediminis]
MEKSKTGKPAFAVGRYLKYAIGEIVLVIIGILIAVSINGWNEDRKLKNEEKNSLKDLRTELASNIEGLAKVVEFHQRSFDSASKLQSLFNDEEAFKVMPDSLYRKLVRSMVLTYTFNPNLGILKSLISSGKINTISNKELLYSLSSLEDTIIDALEDQIRITGLMDNLIEKIVTACMDTSIFQNSKDISTCRFYNPTFRHMTQRLYINLGKNGLIEERALIEKFNHILVLIDEEIKK